MPASGLIAKNFGWPSVFYVSGFFGMSWFALWSYFVTDKPENDPWITQAELDYIKQSLGKSNQKVKVEKSFHFFSTVSIVYFNHFCISIVSEYFSSMESNY